MDILDVCGNILSTKNYSYFVLKCFECDAELGQWSQFVSHLQEHLEHTNIKDETKTEIVLVPDELAQDLCFIKDEVELPVATYVDETEQTMHKFNLKQTKKLQEFSFNIDEVSTKEVSFAFLEMLKKARVLWDGNQRSSLRDKTKAFKAIKEKIQELGWTTTEANLRRTTSRILRQCQQAKEDLAKDYELDKESKYLYNLCTFINEDTDTCQMESLEASNNEESDNESDSDGSAEEKSQSTVADLPLVTNGKFKNGHFKRIRFYVPGNALATELINLFRDSPILWDIKRKDYNNLLDRKAIISSWIPLFRQRHGLELTYDDLSYNLQTLRKYVTLLQNRKERRRDAAVAASILEQCNFLPQSSPGAAINCEHCGRRSKTLQTYQAHLYAVHKIGECPYKCLQCNKDFCNASQRDIHIKVVHTKELDYPCPKCELRFVSRCYLDLHMMVHLGVKNFICETCGKRFRRRVGLNNHERRIHLRQRNFACTMCCKAFYTKALLRDHTNAHLDIRNYKCPTCEKAFHSAHSLMRHKQIHAAVKKYACKLCDARFHQFVGLNAHMKNRHKFITTVACSESAPNEMGSTIENVLTVTTNIGTYSIFNESR